MRFRRQPHGHQCIIIEADDVLLESVLLERQTVDFIVAATEADAVVRSRVARRVRDALPGEWWGPPEVSGIEAAGTTAASLLEPASEASPLLWLPLAAHDTPERAVPAALLAPPAADAEGHADTDCPIVRRC